MARDVIVINKNWMFAFSGNVGWVMKWAVFDVGKMNLTKHHIKVLPVSGSTKLPSFRTILFCVIDCRNVLLSSFYYSIVSPLLFL